MNRLIDAVDEAFGDIADNRREEIVGIISDVSELDAEEIEGYILEAEETALEETDYEMEAVTRIAAQKKFMRFLIERVEEERDDS